MFITDEELPNCPISRRLRSLFPLASRVNLLFDRDTLTTAYPRLTVSGGKGAKIRLTYAEALFDKDGHKGDRDASTTAVLSASATAFFPMAASIAPLNLCGGGPGAISTSTLRPAASRSRLSRSLPASPPTPSCSAPASTPAMRSWTRSTRSVGGPRGSTPMKPTWTRPTTSSCSTPATRAFRCSSPMR